MKIMWICGVLTKAAEKVFSMHSNGGLWIDATYDELQKHENIDLCVVTSGKVNELKYAVEGRNSFYLLPFGLPYYYKCGISSRIEQIKKIIDEEKPHLIHIWGFEFLMSFDVLQCRGNIPAIVFIQGVMNSIPRYFEAGIERRDIRKYKTLYDIIFKEYILTRKRIYELKASYENQMINMADGVIGEGKWSYAYCYARNNKLKFYRCPLSINRCYYDKKWDIENIDKYSIVCNSAAYSIKGLHMLIRALEIVKREFPQAHLYVPGSSAPASKTLHDRLRRNGYTNYVIHLSEKLGVTENVTYLDYLSAEALADRLSKSHVFALVSSTENHSSSLKEAMLVGIPSVSSYVGEIPEYAVNGKNVLFHRFEDYEMLAFNIITIFKNNDLARSLSATAREDMYQLHIKNDVGNIMEGIYKQAIEAGKNPN